jgi:hypothetical protein
MTVFDAWRDGIRRVNRAPAVLIGVWVMTVLVSLPLMAAMRGLLRDHLGASLAADSAAGGVNYDWMQEFTSQASGVGVTFGPAVLGFAAVLDNLSAFLDNTPQPVIVAFAAATYLGLWVFLAGGIIDRYARDRRTHAHGFFGASGVFFFRFLRLGVLMGLAYGLLVRYLHPWLFGTLYPRVTNDLTVERTAFLIRLGLYALFALGLAACNVLFDYAKVRAVVEDRRSMLGATAAAARFIVRNAPTAVGLYLVNVVLFGIVLAAYALVAPGAGGAGWSMWLAFVIGQAYVLARLWVKLVFWATETALFQGRLAHAGYVAAPVREWPEGPIAEAIGSSKYKVQSSK